ncbi:hypothetical protein [Streptomyces acidiscabies]|uniref:hypothetical protein n=1 Tax=Streptomyces acidiscabies TaxID=42234 RepID=UPI000952D6C1|nr:hypothetical protein [Streptomyces acidiscabies]
MNEPTADLLRDATRRLERAILERDCPAIAALQGDRKLLLSDYDYLRDQETARAFEDRAADKAREINAVRVALVVPQVWLFATDTIYSRAVANLPLREGEQELIAWTVFDIHDGVDYGYLPYTRRPNGAPVFDTDHSVINVPTQPYDNYPGLHLLRNLMQDG